MDKYFKGSLKVFTNYLTFFVIFAVFISILMGLAREKFLFWLPVYSAFIFILMFMAIYTEMHHLAFKEKRPQYDLKPYPLKGFVLGIIGFSPIILLQLAYPFINFHDEIMTRLKHVALNTLLGPLYFIVRFIGETVWGYAAASLAVSVVAGLGYMAGFYGFEITAYYRKYFKNNKTDNNTVSKNNGSKGNVRK